MTSSGRNKSPICDTKPTRPCRNHVGGTYLESKSSGKRHGEGEKTVRRGSALGQSLPPVGPFNNASSHPANGGGYGNTGTMRGGGESQIQPMALV